MSGDEVLNEAGRFIAARDRFARSIGIDLIEARPGYARARMDLRPNHFNSVEVVHGGAIFTLADLAFAAAANSHGVVSLGINVSISYIKAGRGEFLEAVATEDAINPKLGTYTVRVTDDQGDLVALFQGTVYRKKDPYPPPEPARGSPAPI